MIAGNLGGPYAFTGFPLGERCGSYYIPAELSQCMSIPSRGANPAGAWAYIRSQLTEEAQLRYGAGLPVNCAALLSLAHSQLEDEGDISLLTGLLERTDAARTWDDDALREIILECGGKYLAGECTAAEAASEIQSRAGLYLAEQYG